MKPIRWSEHALQALAEREIDRAEADRVVQSPEAVTAGQPARMVHMSRYLDEGLGRETLLRVVLEEKMEERVVVTVYKTSHITKYLGDVQT